MTKQRVVIQDLNSAIMPVITEMIVVDVTTVTGSLIRFQHEDGSATIINIASGWNLTISEYDEDN